MTDARFDRDFGAKVQRDVMPSLGARFFREGDELMFTFVIDTGNVIGPRPANKTDSEKHPEAWAEFNSGETGPQVVSIVPDARPEEPPAAPESIVPEKDMGGFVALIEPAPELTPKRKYTRKVA